MALTLIKSTGTNFTANTLSIATNYVSGLIPPIICNDISCYFDGQESVFPLTQDYTSINTVVDSKDVQVVLNGVILSPYVTEIRYPWLTPYDAFKGYKVSGGNLIIYNAPGVGDTATVIIVNTSQTVQKRKYPFSASTIALGD